MDELTELQGLEIMRKSGCIVGGHTWAVTSVGTLPVLPLVLKGSTITGSATKIYATPAEGQRCNCGLVTWPAVKA